MKFKIIAITVFLLVALPLIACAAKDEFGVRAYVNKKSIFIGDVIRYTVEVKAKNNIEVSLPKFKDNKIDEFEIKDSSDKIKNGLFGKDTFINTYYLTVYSTGLQIIPALEIKYRKIGAPSWLSKKTESINIRVASVLPEGVKVADIKDIKGPIQFFRIPWLLLSVLILILAILTAVFIIYKRRKERAALKLPHEIALEGLNALHDMLASGGDAKEYYVGISDCIRRYIESVFKVKAPEMTTEEFLNSLKDSSALSTEQKDLLKAFLNACDLVKFAKYTPTRPEIESVYESAKNFIEETKHLCLPSKTPGS